MMRRILTTLAALTLALTLAAPVGAEHDQTGDHEPNFVERDYQPPFLPVVPGEWQPDLFKGGWEPCYMPVGWQPNPNLFKGDSQPWWVPGEAPPPLFEGQQ